MSDCHHHSDPGLWQFPGNRPHIQTPVPCTRCEAVGASTPQRIKATVGCKWLSESLPLTHHLSEQQPPSRIVNKVLGQYHYQTSLIINIQRETFLGFFGQSSNMQHIQQQFPALTFWHNLYIYIFRLKKKYLFLSWTWTPLIGQKDHGKVWRLIKTLVVNHRFRWAPAPENVFRKWLSVNLMSPTVT